MGERGTGSGYPQHWEADVVLRDASTCHVRPIRSDDGERLMAFHARLSAATIYYRFFAPYPRLTARDVERFTRVDYRDRVALVAIDGDDIVGVVRYERTAPDEAEAEVAFVIDDAHQGRGLGPIFLERIAQAARERGIHRFVAEVLPRNTHMLEVFERAAYRPDPEAAAARSTARADGFITVQLDISRPVR